MEKSLTKFKGIVNDIKARRSMFIFDDSYTSLASFLIGYCLALKELEDYDVSMSIQEWLRGKVGTHFSVHWTYYILNHLAKRNEDIAEKVLFELLDEFFNLKIKELC